MSRLQELRKNAGLTQQALSDMTGIPKRSIEDMEADVKMHLYTAKGETLFKLSKALKCTLDDLLTDCRDIRWSVTHQIVVDKGFGWEGKSEAYYVYTSMDEAKARHEWSLGYGLNDDEIHDSAEYMHQPVECFSLVRDEYENGECVDCEIIESKYYHL